MYFTPLSANIRWFILLYTNFLTDSIKHVEKNIPIYASQIRDLCKKFIWIEDLN